MHWDEIVVYSGYSGFNDYIEPLIACLRAKGYKVSQVASFQPRARVFYLIFGLMNFDHTLPVDGYAVIQLEQATSAWMTPAYLQRLKQAPFVWEFSPAGLALLREHNINAYHVPLGRSLNLLPEPNAEPSLDLLFFGSMNARRTALIEQLRANGLRVHVETMLYGEERDRLIDQSKIVLNLHYYEHASLEQLRVIPALLRGKLVISEASRDRLPIALFAADTDELLTLCREWLSKTEAERRVVATELLAQVPDFASVVPWQTFNGVKRA